MKICRLAIAALLLWVMISAAGAAPGGTIYLTTKQMDAGSPTFEKDVKEAAVKAFDLHNDAWKVHFVAYLNKAAGAEELNIVFYPTTGKRELVSHYPLRTQAKAKILMSEVELRPEQGFRKGGKFQMLITRLLGGREVVYARTIIELK